MRKETRMEYYVTRTLIILGESANLKTQASLLDKVQFVNSRALNKTRFRKTLREMTSKGKIIEDKDKGFVLNWSMLPGYEPLKPYLEEFLSQPAFLRFVLKWYDSQHDKTITQAESPSMLLIEMMRYLNDSGMSRQLKGRLTKGLLSAHKFVSKADQNEILAVSKCAGIRHK